MTIAIELINEYNSDDDGEQDHSGLSTEMSDVRK